MKFCSSCGSSIQLTLHKNDSVPRHTCGSCGEIFYQNPVVVAGCVPFWQGKILLCRRALEPGYGFWTVPGGYLESGETVEECAAREAREEAHVQVELGQLISVTNVIAANQVHVLFQADMTTGFFAPGDETLEARLFDPEDIPWNEIAFDSVENTLRQSIDLLNGTADTPFAISQDCLRPPLERLRVVASN